MGTITTRDGTEIFYKDWGSGRPVVFSHGWPLTADAWDDQLFLVASNGYRAVAHDRRGGGRSGQPWNGNDLDTYADDLAELIEALDLHDAVLVGHSTGGGEVTRYIGRHGTSRVAKAVLVSAIPPLMLKTDANPGGLPIEVFDGLRASLSADRSQFYEDISAPFYGANRPGNTVSQGLRDSFWRNCQYLWMRKFQAAAASSSLVAAGDGVLASGAWSSARSTSLPSSNVAPARTSATRCGALTRRQRRWADSMSL
jgi:non-heme chloroperoxidase